MKKTLLALLLALPAYSEPPESFWRALHQVVSSVLQ
jgi:hypothetical protein